MGNDDKDGRAQHLNDEARRLRQEMAKRSDESAEVFDSLALLHDRMADTDGHPLQSTAADRAAEEHRMADEERAEGARLREDSDPGAREAGD